MVVLLGKSGKDIPLNTTKEGEGRPRSSAPAPWSPSRLHGNEATWVPVASLCRCRSPKSEGSPRGRTPQASLVEGWEEHWPSSRLMGVLDLTLPLISCVPGSVTSRGGWRLGDTTNRNQSGSCAQKRPGSGGPQIGRKVKDQILEVE